MVCLHAVVYTNACLPKDESMRFETCRRRQKLKNLIKDKFEKCAFRWFILHNYITIHGANTI